MLYSDSLDAAWLAALRVYDPNVFTKILLRRNSRVMEDYRRFGSKPHNCLAHTCLTFSILPHFFKCLRQQGNCWKRDISSHSEHEKKKSIHHQTQLRAEADVVRAGSPSWTIFFFRIKSNKHEPTAVWTPSTLPPVPADRDDVLLAFAILLKGLWGGKGW